MVAEIHKLVDAFQFPGYRCSVPEEESVDIQSSPVTYACSKPGFAFTGFRIPCKNQKYSLRGSGQNKRYFTIALRALMS